MKRCDSRIYISIIVVLFCLNVFYLNILTTRKTYNCPSENGEWKSGYNISNTCKLREDRLNPRDNPEAFPCPVSYKWGNFTEQFKEYTTWDFEKTELSSRKCYEDSRFCEYKNVCVKGGRQTILYHYRGPTVSPNSFGWWAYRKGTIKRFSWNYNVQTIDHNPGSSSSSFGKVKWVNGTSIWYDQSYANMCHIGHSSEFYFKLLELRRKFPGPIDQIIYAHLEEFDRADAFKLCHIPCNMMRIGFPDKNYVFPPIYWLRIQNEWYNQDTMCFEKLLVPANTHQHFTSSEAADYHRRQALQMCKIPERPTPPVPQKVLFSNRVVDRRIHNQEELCEKTKSLGLEAYSESMDDLPNFCQIVATVYTADIIISVDGSSNQLLAYARPGSVLILVYPFNFRAPDWKVLANLVGMRVLEIITIDKKYSIRNPTLQKPNEEEALNTRMIDCFSYKCRSSLRHRDTIVPMETYEKFLERAFQIWNKKDVDPCELQMPWPMAPNTESPHKLNWARYSWAMNFQVCDLPQPDCICCKSTQCMETQRMDRGF